MERPKLLLKKRKAQQIVEFLLVAPFMIIFFLFLTEIAITINTKVFFNNALEYAIQEVYKNPSMVISTAYTSESVPASTTALENFIGFNVSKYLTTHYVSNGASVNNVRLTFNPTNNSTTGIQILDPNDGKKYVIFAKAIYHSTIIPSGLWRLIVGDNMNFTSIQILDKNIVDMQVSQSTNIVIYDSDVNASAMKNPNFQSQMAFAIKVSNSPVLYKIYNWSGIEINSPNNLTSVENIKSINFSDIKMVVIYDNYDNLTENDIGSNWTILRERMLTMTKNNGSSIGNYENIGINTNNIIDLRNNIIYVMPRGSEISQ